MQDPISPLERSRQILQEIESEMNEKRMETDSGEQYTTEDSQPEDTSAIYHNEIGKAVSDKIKFDRRSLLQGIIFSEILREPKSIRRSRR